MTAHYREVLEQRERYALVAKKISRRPKPEQRSVIWFIIHSSVTVRARFSIDSNDRVPVLNGAGPLRRPAVPMSHQRLVEKFRLRSRPYASTIETWIALAKCARSCRAPRNSLAASSPGNRSDQTPERGRRYWGRLRSNRRTPELLRRW